MGCGYGLWGCHQKLRRQLCADFVEEVGFVDVRGGRRVEALGASGRRRRLRRDQLGELTQVLSRGGQEELVSGAAETTQAQPVELQDALEVGEQHLDLLALSP